MFKNRIIGLLIFLGGIAIAYAVRNDLGSFLSGIVSTIGFVMAVTGKLGKKISMKSKYLFILQLLVSLCFIALGIYVIIANPGYGVSAAFKLILAILVIGVFVRTAIMAVKKLMAASSTK